MPTYTIFAGVNGSCKTSIVLIPIGIAWFKEDILQEYL